MTNFTPHLRLASEYIKTHGWITGAEQNGYGQVSLTGALRYCTPSNGDAQIIRGVLRKRDRAEE